MSIYKRILNAIKEKNINLLTELLKQKPDLNNTKLYNGTTPLIYACYYKNPEAIKILIECGSDVNQKNEDNASALEVICESFEKNGKTVANIVRMLLDAGATVLYRNSRKDNALHKAVMFGHYQAAKMLLEAGAKPNIKGLYGRTALHYAATKSNSRLVKILLDYKANPNIINEGRETPLDELISTQRPNLKSAKLLIEKSKLDHEDDYYGSYLHQAAARGRVQIIDILLDAGMDINLKNFQGLTALDIAIAEKNTETIKFLLKKGAKITKNGYTNIFEAFVKSKDIEFIKWLLENHYDEEMVTDAAFEACYYGNLEILKTFIENGLNINVGEKYSKETLLMKASYNGQVNIVRYLIEKGSDVNLKSSEKNTALMFAAGGGHLEIVKILVEKGSDLNAVNKYGWNALMQAVLVNHYKIVEYLLEKGSKTDVIDQEWGYTPLDLADVKGYSRIRELLKKYGSPKRKVKKRKKNQQYFAIFECDICNYMPNERDLEGTENMRSFDKLELIDVKYETPDRFTDNTYKLLKCPNCGTFYLHYHSIDTEDAFVGGANISQSIMRLNEQRVYDYLKKIKSEDELERFKVLRKEKILKYEKVVYEGALDNNFFTFVIDALIDEYILRKNFEKIKKLTEHRNKKIAKHSISRLKKILNQSPEKSIFTIYQKNDFSKRVKKKLKELADANNEFFGKLK